jgi:two-component system response regulator YesN
MQSFLDLYTKNLFSKEEDINKIKNSLFELLITAKNKTKKIVENFEDTSFDNAFSFLISEDNLPALKNYVQNRLLECTTSINSIKKQIENPIIKKICAYINQNLSEDISLEQMSEYTNVSSFYLSKLFKEEKGVTFITFITDTRLDKAQKLLKETELSIKEITAQIGYNDQNYFSRIFKNKFGITPSEARKKL